MRGGEGLRGAPEVRRLGAWVANSEGQMQRSPGIQFRFRAPAIVAFLACALGLSGCVGMAAGGAAAVGVAAAQERSIGAAIDDATIDIEINHLLLQKSEALFRRVGIDVVEARVLLTGNVPTPDERVQAARLAWQAAGVREVLNEIQVDDRSGIIDYFKDARISWQLRFKILTDRDISDINYTIETVNGVIYVMGIARDQKELDKVTGHASNIPGVVKVVGHVRLRDDPRRRT